LALRGELHTADDSVAILIAGRMEEWKGHAGLLEALRLLQGNPRWTCWIAGGAQRPTELAYMKQLQDLADRFGISGRLRWLGQRADIPDLMAAADLYCQPNSGAEPFGIVFIEALYASTPIAATRLGGALEIVDDSCGVLVEPANHEALAKTLDILINTPELRRSLGSQGPRSARDLCDPEQQLHQLLRQIEQAKLAASKRANSSTVI
jgi:glycosyltransferase involved in cell wall biosynthesis